MTIEQRIRNLRAELEDCLAYGAQHSHVLEVFDRLKELEQRQKEGPCCTGTHLDMPDGPCSDCPFYR